MKTVIYHRNCNDGFCAAWVAWHKFGDEARYVAANYGDEPPTIDGHDVLIVDFSYPRAKLYEMSQRARKLEVLDHHKTAQADLTVGPNGEAFCFMLFDMNRSGAGLAWDFLFPDESRPWFVEAVQDRDLWLWQYPHSKELNAAITTWPREFAFWQGQLSSAAFENAISDGRAINRYIDQYTDEMCARARIVEFEGYEVPCVNVPYKGISEICGKLAETAPFSIGWAQGPDGKFTYSLRSRGDFDVSAIAKKYGGGGHKNSAGFMSSSLLF